MNCSGICDELGDMASLDGLYIGIQKVLTSVGYGDECAVVTIGPMRVMQSHQALSIASQNDSSIAS